MNDSGLKLLIPPLRQPVKVGEAGTGLTGDTGGSCDVGTVVVGAGGGVEVTKNACPDPPTMNPSSFMSCALEELALGRTPKSVKVPSW